LKILFFYLDAFSQTGGIENFNKAFVKALSDLSVENDLSFKAVSVHDSDPDERYIAKENYKGFKGSKIRSSYYAIKSSLNYDQIILGHINLAIVGMVIKVIRPSARIILIAHGIEVWEKLHLIKGAFLKRADKIFAVSNFTKEKLVTANNIDPTKVEILHNTLDPYFKIPDTFVKPAYLLDRYKTNKDAKIILTVTRITDTENEKGYDKVIEILSELIKEDPNIIYILAGKYTPKAGSILKKLVKDQNLESNFILTGYIPESEMTDHYLLADVFVLPSRQEGFGIVFIEAAACGVPVIAGNMDGSIDALNNGEFGRLVNPENSAWILQEIKDILNRSVAKTTVSSNVTELYSFKNYHASLKNLLLNQRERN
jgi:phosphatidylinositol alpha-1,6-mannosyltransferase